MRQVHSVLSPTTSAAAAGCREPLRGPGSFPDASTSVGRRSRRGVLPTRLLSARKTTHPCSLPEFAPRRPLECPQNQRAWIWQQEDQDHLGLGSQPRAADNVWRHFWWLHLGDGCRWHLAVRGRGWYQRPTPHRTAPRQRRGRPRMTTALAEKPRLGLARVCLWGTLGTGPSGTTGVSINPKPTPMYCHGEEGRWGPCRETCRGAGAPIFPGPFCSLRNVVSEERTTWRGESACRGSKPFSRHISAQIPMGLVGTDTFTEKALGRKGGAGVPGSGSGLRAHVH